MPPADKSASLELESREEERDERTVYLEHGRTLAVTSEGLEQLIEVRASSGQVELRIRMTEEGPVLQLDGIKLELSAEESVAIKCKDFKVDASESMALTSQGSLTVASEAQMELESTAEVHVRGEKIFLN